MDAYEYVMINTITIDLYTIKLKEHECRMDIMYYYINNEINFTIKKRQHVWSKWKTI